MVAKKKKPVKKVEVEGPAPKTKADSKSTAVKKLILVVVMLLVVFLAIFLFVNYGKSFKYEGVDFQVVKTGSLMLYNTKIPVTVDGEKHDYNFYLRKDPRVTARDVPFEGGNISLRQVLVINTTQEFNCDGFGVIAVANLVNLYKVSGINVIKDPNATCDEQGRYAFVNIQPGNETSVVKTGPACYEINIKDCEILEGTERLMIESFIKINEVVR